MRAPAAQASTVATPGGIMVEYEKLKDASQYTLPASIYDNYKSFSESFNEMGVEDIGGFEEIIRTLAMGAILLFIGINLLNESFKGDYSINIFIRAFMIACISLAVIGTSGQTLRGINAALDQAGDAIVTRASEHAEGLPAEDADSIIDVMFYNPMSGSAQQSSTASSESSGEQSRAEQRRDEEERAEAMMRGEIDSATPEVIADLKAGMTAEELQDKYSIEVIQQARDDMNMAQIVLVLPCLVASLLACVQVLEVKIRGIFSPLAIANLTLEGTRSPGFRYLKKYLGCYLKIFLIFAIASICATLGSRMITAGTTLQLMGVAVLGANISIKGISILLMNLIGVFMMFQSTSLVNEVLE